MTIKRLAAGRTAIGRCRDPQRLHTDRPWNSTDDRRPIGHELIEPRRVLVVRLDRYAFLIHHLRQTGLLIARWHAMQFSTQEPASVRSERRLDLFRRHIWAHKWEVV